MPLRWGVMGSGRFFRIIVFATVPLLFFTLYFLWSTSITVTPWGDFTATYAVPEGQHPIDQLILDADEKFENLASNASTTLEDAARAYRRRRGRHPPPGFDRWFNFAQKFNATIIEPLFDQIYHDLEPFWGAEPSKLREFSQTWHTALTIRHHQVKFRTGTGKPTIFEAWLVHWGNFIRFLPPLPDVDLAFWIGDEPRVLLPFEKLSRYMAKAGVEVGKHNRVPIRSIRQFAPEYPKLLHNPSGTEDALQAHDYVTFNKEKTYWDYIVEACKPDDPIFTDRDRRVNSSFPLVFSDKYTTGTTHGYISNATIAKSVCHNPNLRTLHGHLIAPNLKGLFTDLKPIFAVAKLSGITNDILVPTPEHFAQLGHHEALQSSTPWTKKKAKVLWRGTATGGSHNASNWWGFQRHRLVAMLNHTNVGSLEKEMTKFEKVAKNPSKTTYNNFLAKRPKKFDWGKHNIPYPNRNLFNITAQQYGALGHWTSQTSDAGFTHFYCDANVRLGNTVDNCSYTDPYYNLTEKTTLSQALDYKYLPDVDGQSTSGRFRAFLQSLSVPIKATIFVEWRDDRLVPWRHYVPLSNEFQEWWALLEYFVGYRGARRGERSIRAHDKQGERIGRLGSEWMAKVVRREDMLVYFHRLILEYARVSADERVELGWVEDLKGGMGGRGGEDL